MKKGSRMNSRVVLILILISSNYSKSIQEQRVRRRDVVNIATKDAVTKTKCDKSCMVIAVSCILALFFLILVVSLCYAMNCSIHTEENLHKNSTQQILSFTQKEIAPSTLQLDSIRPHQNFPPYHMRKKPVLKATPLSTLGNGVGVVSIYYRNTRTFSSPDASYDLSFDSNKMRQNIKTIDDVPNHKPIKLLNKTYKMTNPSECDHRHSESEVSESNEHSFPRLPEITNIDKENVNKKIIEVKLETDKTSKIGDVTINNSQTRVLHSYNVSISLEDGFGCTNESHV